MTHIKIPEILSIRCSCITVDNISRELKDFGKVASVKSVYPILVLLALEIGTNVKVSVQLLEM